MPSSVGVRFPILGCLAPSRQRVALLAPRELLLCLEIHSLPDRGFKEKQEIVKQLADAGVLQA